MTTARVTLHDRWLTVDSTVEITDGDATTTVRCGDVRRAAAMVAWTGVPGRLPWSAVMVVCIAAGWKPSGDPWSWLPPDDGQATADVLEVPVEPERAVDPGVLL
ncbi:hypothetical protein Drose_06040 [Dactylosporangium roseum]|uniref:Uncharacterized protein n=1 Tax=Dactylosporangium roseum TaxID=47989 RepID=A0ABY5Z7K6_9ACTN|nr:hypothetical protein [Dactylosporangium roseum]UWZ37832.1 hypothetical protein Drose_06040 [Dactylosporangium roseum]